MKVTFLGAAGWLPREQKTSSVLIEHKDELIILDAGSGILNLSEKKDLLAKYKKIHLILSHYHFDHIIGLTYLDLFISKESQLIIYGPKGRYYKKGPKKILDKMMSSPYTPHTISNTYFRAIIKSYDEGTFMINDISIKVSKQIHTDYSFSIGIDGLLLYATDTEFYLDTIIEKTNYKLTIHECWDDQIKETKGHTYFQELLTLEQFIKKDCKIALIHVNPLIEEKSLNNIKQNLKRINGFIGYDLLEFKI